MVKQGAEGKNRAVAFPWDYNTLRRENICCKSTLKDMKIKDVIGQNGGSQLHFSRDFSGKWGMKLKIQGTVLHYALSHSCHFSHLS